MIDAQFQRDIEESAPLTDAERFCLRSYYLCKTKEELIKAYRYSRQDVAREIGIEVNATKWGNSIKVRAYMRILERRYSSQINEDDTGFDIEDFKNKGTIIKMYKDLHDQTNDDKLKASLLDKIASLEGHKRSETLNNVNIQYFLPHRCSDCSLKCSAYTYKSIEFDVDKGVWVGNPNYVHDKDKKQ